MIVKKPKFPITVKFLEDGDVWVLDGENEIASNLEWFDTDDPSENVVVTDGDGKRVRILVKNLVLKECFIE